MELSQEYIDLIDKFLDESLSDEEKKQFSSLMSSNKDFAKEVEELAYTDAALEAIGQSLRNELPTSRPKPTHTFSNKRIKKIYLTTVSVAASIILLLGFLFFNEKSKPPKIIVEMQTDTLKMYYRQADEIPQLAQVAPLEYGQNRELDQDVENCKLMLRGNSNSEYSHPLHDSKFHVTDTINFALTRYKPGKYKLHILAFPKYVTAVDTICNINVEISTNNKNVLSWQPKYKGVYYWMAYPLNKEQSLFVKRFTVY